MTKWLKTRVKELVAKWERNGTGNFYASDISAALDADIFKVMDVLVQLEKEGMVRKSFRAKK